MGNTGIPITGSYHHRDHHNPTRNKTYTLRVEDFVVGNIIYVYERLQS